jgi:hypothetical protein
VAGVQHTPAKAFVPQRGVYAAVKVMLQMLACRVRRLVETEALLRIEGMRDAAQGAAGGAIRLQFGIMWQGRVRSHGREVKLVGERQV